MGMSRKLSKQDRLRAVAKTRFVPSLPMKTSPLSKDKLLEKLHVHQVELVMQNEELQRTQIALKESRDRYANLYELAPVGYLTLTHEGIIQEINLTGATLLGIEREKLINRHFYTLVAPNDSDRWHLLFKRLMRQEVEEKHNIKVMLRRSNNTVFHAQLNCLYLLNNDNVPIVRIMLTDITERKHTEEELRIAAVTFQSQEAIVICDSQGIILQVNQAFIESTSYTDEEAVGQNVNLLKSERHNEAFYSAIWKCIKRTGSWQGEIWFRQKNGTTCPKWLIITAVKGNDGIVTHYVGSHIDITERKAAEDELKQLAFYDPLTQLPNRLLLQERLKHGIDVERRAGKQLALLMLDLDHFKAVNDSLGHQAGDELLQQVATRITERLRAIDMVARLGGDEFVVLLEDIIHPQDAAQVAEAIITDLGKPFKLAQNGDVQIGVSIGISLYPQHGNNSELLMEHADAALYRAKNQGRGCFAYYSKSMTITACERIELQTRIRRAIQKNELRVLYQPKMDIASDRIIGAEALVRWENPREGLILPFRFIPIAEETSLIMEIGEWVLRETCNQGRQWLADGLPLITLAVNVSPHQFSHSDLCALVATVLAELSFPAKQLELEITESGLMENQDNATAILNRLRAQGVCLAIDDFGTGYSSLAYLKRFPVDVLKIDKRFIDDIPFHQDDMEIAATIIAMGHILGFKVLAEGVETPEQLAFLQEKGCDSYQGFLKSKAVSAKAFATLLRDQQQDKSGNGLAKKGGL